MTGKLYVIGVGPGNPLQMTPQAADAISASSEFFGYKPYLDRLELRSDQIRHASDNRQEIERAQAALEAACRGVDCCIVSGGDPGVFAMAAAVCEAIETGEAHWRSVNLEIVPGVTAMSAVAARLGAPLGNDFCAISLSDNLKPWELIEKRLALAAQAGFVIALYNPISVARPWQLREAMTILAAHLPGETLVIFAKAVGRPSERIIISDLKTVDTTLADMSTCVIIGSSETRRVERPEAEPLIYTPRFVRSRST